MQVIRSIVWVLLLIAFVAFSVANWETGVEVKIWENLVWDTKLPAVVVVAFLIGLLPMWLLHLATRWHLRRRIGSLEKAARAAAYSPAPPQSQAGPQGEPLPEEPRTGEIKPTLP